MDLRLFPSTDRSGFSDWARYLWCRIVGHLPTGPAHWRSCLRCHDALPQPGKRQP